MIGSMSIFLMFLLLLGSCSLSEKSAEQQRFAIIGDYGLDGKGLKATAEMIKKWQPDYILTLGDNNYHRGCQETFEKNVSQYFGKFIAEKKFYPAIGNHDYDAFESQECEPFSELPHFKNFDLPRNRINKSEAFYQFKKGELHFFVLDSNKKYRHPEQSDWLREELKKSDADFKIVYFHHTPYSSTISKKGGEQEMRLPYKEWGADIVFAGHDHVYERFEFDSFPYIVNGLGGGWIFMQEKIQRSGQSLVFYRENHGAIFAILRDSTLEFVFQSIDGKVIDRFSLTKSQ